MRCNPSFMSMAMRAIVSFAGLAGYPREKTATKKQQPVTWKRVWRQMGGINRGTRRCGEYADEVACYTLLLIYIVWSCCSSLHDAGNKMRYGNSIFCEPWTKCHYLFLL